MTPMAGTCQRQHLAALTQLGIIRWQEAAHDSSRDCLLRLVLALRSILAHAHLAAITRGVGYLECMGQAAAPLAFQHLWQAAAACTPRHALPPLSQRISEAFCPIIKR